MTYKKSKNLAIFACSAVLAASLAGAEISLSAMNAFADTADETGITLSAESLSLKIGGQADLTVTLPDGVTAASYEWTSSASSIATPDENQDETGTITAWAFGSTTITVVVTDTEGVEYTASADVLVAADYFYLTGIQGDWSTYATEEEAKAAGVLLEEESAGVYSLTTTLWANDGFQIINSDMDEAWTTKLTPYWYDAASSSDEYVANSGDMFAVNSYGKYTVKLDLTDGAAKVSIVKDLLSVTGINFSFEGDAVLKGIDDTVVAKIELTPEDAVYDVDDLIITVTNSADDDSYYDYVVDKENLTVTFTLMMESEEEITIYLNVQLGDASNTTLIAIADSDTVLVEDVAFDAESYAIDVNNGGEEWSVTVSASVTNDDATVKGILYSTTDAGITVDAETGKVVASQFGVFTVTATAIGDSSKTAEVAVYVYSSQYYLIGKLQSVTVNDWTAPDVSVTDLSTTAFANWGLTVDADSNNTKYSGEFTLYEGDLFTIAYLGMPGSWYGNINSAYLNGESEYISVNGTNVQVNKTAVYTVTLDISGATPVFTVEYVKDAEKPTEQTLTLYVVRAGGSWNSNTTEEGNIIATLGEVTINSDGGITVTFSNIDFYGIEPWPTFQFVTATNILNGAFVNATWYGSGTDIEFSGNAYSAEGTDGTFSNGGYGCQMWWCGSQVEGGMTVDITVTFSAEGSIASMQIDFAE